MTFDVQEPAGDAALDRLLASAARGDQAAITRLLEGYRGRLRRMIHLRFDRRVQGKVDPSDIIQETYLEASSRLAEYVANPTLPFYVWLRLLAAHRLIDQYRRHLGTQARDLSREFTLHHGGVPEATSAALAAQLLGRLSTPSEAAVRVERQLRLQEALNQMDSTDREILALRHFEQMSNNEVALALGLDKAAASKRYTRALLRLKDILSSMPGGLDSL